MLTKTRIPSVNFHLWEPCNMRCGFCFARFQDVKSSILPKGHLPAEQAMKVVKQLGEYGFQKITFAGGEPTLCPWLPELVQEAKKQGMLTMIVTNGTQLDRSYLKAFRDSLDWVVLSIDSLNPETNKKTGRHQPNQPGFHPHEYANRCQLIRSEGFQLKINTVVHAYNWQENLQPFIISVRPARWKVLQILSVKGQNDHRFSEYDISEAQFMAFCARNDTTDAGIPFVPESTEVIRGSYVMVDPAGRFFDSTRGQHTYSQPILSVEIETALAEIQVDVGKFWLRDGGYYLD